MDTRKSEGVDIFVHEDFKFDDLLSFIDQGNRLFWPLTVDDLEDKKVISAVHKVVSCRQGAAQAEEMEFALDALTPLVRTRVIRNLLASFVGTDDVGLFYIDLNRFEKDEKERDINIVIAVLKLVEEQKFDMAISLSKGISNESLKKQVLQKIGEVDTAS